MRYILKSFVIPLHMDTKPGSVAAVVRFSIVTLVDSCRVYALWESIVSTQTLLHIYICVSLQLSVQNAVSAQPCVGKLGISLVLLNFLGCNCGL